MNTKLIFGLVVAGALSVGIAFWLTRPVPKLPTAHVGILADVTDSMLHDKHDLAITALIHRAISSPHVHKGSKLFLTITGHDSTAYEPIAVGTFKIPFSRAAEGRQKFARKKKEFVAKVVEEYKKHSKYRPRHSPIFLAIKRALSQLQTAGCDEKSHCFLYIRSDGEETAERWLQRAIKRKRLNKRQALYLDNIGIRVVMCGVAQTRGQSTRRKSRPGRRSAKRADNLVAIWRLLYTTSDLVIFEPFCSVAAE